MTKYFTRHHFDLLDQWKEKKRDTNNSEQNKAYEELQEAYSIIEKWAFSVKNKLYSSGRVDVRKRPTSQANVFRNYLWAKIYPEENSPKELAYTVSINTDRGFEVKIDTVGLKDRNPIRQSYLSLRGEFNNSSPIVSTIPREEGLKKTLPELVEWSIEEILGFRIKYEDVMNKISIIREPTDQEVLEHFDSDPEFQEFRSKWNLERKRLFCRLTRAIHKANLDLYHVDIKGEVRFGRKGLGHKSAFSVLGYIRVDGNQIRVRKNSSWFGDQTIEVIGENNWKIFDAQLVDEIEGELRDWDGIPKSHQRSGHWPDEYGREGGQERAHEESDGSRLRRFSLNTILYGPPGTGKTYSTFRRCVEICDETEPDEEGDEAVRDRYRSLAKEGRVEFVTFHQSYGYEEFVEGLRPQTGSADADDGSSVGFRLDPEDGALKRIAERAREFSVPYVLVIDEINRGNISKVFGEAITLIEEDKRAGKPNVIPVTLPYSRKPFTLPPNLYILGTMNTADRSIALIDTALRRRFYFEELPPEPELLGRAGDIDLEDVLKAINNRLEWHLSRDHLIGHAWLMEAEDRETLDRIMRHKIIPMLAEYFHDDWSKIRAVLGGGDGFVERKKLGAPPELDSADIGEDRYRWTIRAEFTNDAYDRLIAGKTGQTDAKDEGAEDDSA